MGFGTLAVPDLIRTAHQNVLDFGQDRLFEYINNLLQSYEAIVRDGLDQLSVQTTDRIMGYGGSSGMVMVETDEFGRADVSKPTPGGNIGIPMRLYQVGVQWTRKWLENHTPAELVAVAQDAMLADTQNLYIALRRALFNPTNYTFVDHLVDNYSLSVKRLANADSFNLPPDPYGNAVDGSTHTHYLARAGGSLAATDIDAVIATVNAHYTRGATRLYINQAQAAAVRGFTAASQFYPLYVAGVQPGVDAQRGSAALNNTQTNDKQIGFWGDMGTEVWVKPWIPANYMLALRVGAGSPPLARRVRNANSGNLRVVVESTSDPLQTRAWEREIGFGVRDRLAAAVLYIGDTTYAAPSGI